MMRSICRYRYLITILCLFLFLLGDDVAACTARQPAPTTSTAGHVGAEDKDAHQHWLTHGGEQQPRTRRSSDHDNNEQTTNDENENKSLPLMKRLNCSVAQFYYPPLKVCVECSLHCNGSTALHDVHMSTFCARQSCSQWNVSSLSATAREPAYAREEDSKKNVIDILGYLTAVAVMTFVLILLICIVLTILIMIKCKQKIRRRIAIRVPKTANNCPDAECSSRMEYSFLGDLAQDRCTSPSSSYEINQLLPPVEISNVAETFPTIYKLNSPLLSRSPYNVDIHTRADALKDESATHYFAEMATDSLQLQLTSGIPFSVSEYRFPKVIASLKSFHEQNEITSGPLSDAQAPLVSNVKAPDLFVSRIAPIPSSFERAVVSNVKASDPLVRPVAIVTTLKHEATDIESIYSNYPIHAIINPINPIIPLLMPQSIDFNHTKVSHCATAMQQISDLHKITACLAESSKVLANAVNSEPSSEGKDVNGTARQKSGLSLYIYDSFHMSSCGTTFGGYGYMPGDFKTCGNIVSRAMVVLAPSSTGTATEIKALPQPTGNDSVVSINECTPVGWRWNGFTIASAVTESIHILVTNDTLYQPSITAHNARIFVTFHMLPHNHRFTEPFLFTVRIGDVNGTDLIEVLYSPTSPDEVPLWRKLTALEGTNGRMLSDNQDPPNHVMLPLNGDDQVFFSLNHFCLFAIQVTENKEKYRNAAVNVFLKAAKKHVATIIDFRVIVGCDEESIADMEKLAVGNGFRKVVSFRYPFFESGNDLELVLEDIMLGDEMILLKNPKQTLPKLCVWTSSNPANFTGKSKLVDCLDSHLTATLTTSQQRGEPMSVNISESLENELTFPVSNQKSTAAMVAHEGHCSQDLGELRSDSCSIQYTVQVEHIPQPVFCPSSPLLLMDYSLIRETLAHPQNTVVEDDVTSVPSSLCSSPCARGKQVLLAINKKRTSLAEDDPAEDETVSSLCMEIPDALDKLDPREYVEKFKSALSIEPDESAATTKLTHTFQLRESAETASVGNNRNAGNDNVTEGNKILEGYDRQRSDQGPSAAPIVVIIKSAENNPNSTANTVDSQSVATGDIQKISTKDGMTVDKKMTVEQSITACKDQIVAAPGNQTMAASNDQTITVVRDKSSFSDKEMVALKDNTLISNEQKQALRAMTAEEREKLVVEVLRQLGPEWDRERFFRNKKWYCILTSVVFLERGKRVLNEKLGIEITPH